MNTTAGEFEIAAELDHGVTLNLEHAPSTSELWEGLRVRYRRHGTRRWSSFVLDAADGHLPTTGMVAQAVAFHAAGGRT